MFETVLVADRGVTAARVIRACERLGAQTMAVHGDDDARAPHVRLADEAVPLGGRRFADTYGDTRKLLEAARRTGAQALHPGASALALDPVFARAVLDQGLAWIGPPPDALEQRTEALGPRLVVVVERDAGTSQVRGVRERLGEVLDEQPVDPVLASSVERAAVEHVESAGADGVWALVVVADRARQGAVVVGHLAVPAAGGSVVPALTGWDPLQAQVRLAAGDGGRRRTSRRERGSRPGAALALQVRAGRDYAGRLRRFRAPEAEGVQVDVGTSEGSRLSSEGDRLLAVVTVSGSDRQEALGRARSAVAAFEVAGLPTTLPLLAELLSDPSYVAGDAPGAPLLERISRS